MLVRLNLPLGEGLARIGTEDKVWKDLAARMREGDSLGQALQRHPQLFPETMVEMVKSAESTAAMGPVLTTLSVWLEDSERLKSQVKQALMYPWVVLVCILAELAFLLLVIVPQVMPPLTTGSSADGTFGFLATAIGATILIVSMGLLLLCRGDGLIRMSFKLPKLRTLTGLAEQALWTRGLAALLRVGVPLPEALDKAGDLALSKAFRAEVQLLSLEVAKGGQLSEVLSHKSWIEPHLRWAIVAGESRQNLVPELELAAKRLETRLGHQATILIRVLEPVALLFIGLLTLMVLLPFWTTLYSGFQAINP